MIWAVLDTNTLVSGMGWGGVPGRVVDLALAGRFVMVTSRPLLSELARVLRRRKLAGVFAESAEIVRLIEAASVVVEPTRTLQVVAEDPADDRVLEAADAAQADFIVTGDRHLLDLGAFEGARIVRPRAFLEVLAKEAGDRE
ncbi:MAG: putative toxin-antitoxin system toxin component, PIN family [Actinomycetota bacterium]